MARPGFLATIAKTAYLVDVIDNWDISIGVGALAPWRLTLTPYILKQRKKLPPETGPEPENVYDTARQLWIDKDSGTPVVLMVGAHADATKFGETTLTETREGADRTESAIQASDFGETIQTRTREGTDQTEGNTVFRASNVGETTMTKTREGADQTEGTILQECDAAYSHF